MALPTSLQYIITGAGHAQTVKKLAVNANVSANSILFDIQAAHKADCNCGASVQSVWKVHLDAHDLPLELLNFHEAAQEDNIIQPYAFVDELFPTQPSESIVSIVCESSEPLILVS